MAVGTPAIVLLVRQKIVHTVHPYQPDARGDAHADGYGAQAAAALGVPPQRLFKTLIATLDGQLVCAVVPVAGHLDLKALARALAGKKAAMADPDAAQRSTGYVLGGISPWASAPACRRCSTRRRPGSTPSSCRPGGAAYRSNSTRPTSSPSPRPRWLRSPPRARSGPDPG